MASAGKEILAFCGSCKMDLMAVVIARVGAKIAKVQCKTCKKEHGFKDAKGMVDPSAAIVAKEKKARKKSDVAASEAGELRSIPIESEWRRLMADCEKVKRVTYTPKSQLIQGDVITHPTFGDGIVLRVFYPDKAEIIFEKEIKLLVHSK